MNSKSYKYIYIYMYVYIYNEKPLHILEIYDLKKCKLISFIIWTSSKKILPYTLVILIEKPRF